MHITVKASSNRLNDLKVDMAEPFEEFYLEDEKYTIRFTLEIFYGRKKAGIIHGVGYDMYKMTNDGETLVSIADMIGGDEFGAFESLYYSRVFKHPIIEDYMFIPIFQVYISTLYIDPAFRNKGIASYILQNLFNILDYCLNMTVHFFVIVPKPQHKVNNRWDDLDDPNDEMKKLMIQVIQKNGYKKLGKSEFYYYNCVKA